MPRAFALVAYRKLFFDLEDLLSVATKTHIPATDRNPAFNNEREMLRRCLCIGSLVLLLASLVATLDAEPRYVPGEILVKPRAGLSETNFSRGLMRRGVMTRRILRHGNIHVVSVPEDQANAVLSSLRNDPGVEFAERDYIAQAAFVVNDPLVTSGAEWHVAQIQADQAWNITAGSTNTIIAILDSGIDSAQPDLAGQVLPGYDFVNNDSNPADDFGHGTAVAGTVAAIGNNGTGVAGVAFGCRLLPVKVVDATGFATYSCIAQGIQYAVDSGARVINLSIAGNAASSTLQDAVNYAWSNNVVVVAAAGNNGNSTPQYPAACDNVIAVSATEPDNSLAWFSSYGSFVSLSAPGDDIWTTQNDTNNPYGAWRGTSFASPIVAGVAALVASENPLLSNTQIVSILEQTADDFGLAGYDTSFGFGQVNALQAVAEAFSEPGGLPASPPPLLGTPTLTNAPATDTNLPSLTIAFSPPNNSRLTTPAIFLAGAAADNSGISLVQVQVNDASQLAEGTTNWSAQVNLQPGLNNIFVRGFDLAGNASPAVTRTFTYICYAPLSVTASGSGFVRPNLDGKLLEIGRVYTLRAVPGRGQAFAGWNGTDSQSPVLSFVMQTNLALTASFVPSPFPSVRGNYTGLMADTNGVLPSNAGYFGLTVTPSGLFTGKLLLAGNQFGFRGQFDLTGAATVSVKRGRINPLMLSLQVDLTNSTDQVGGYVTDGGWTSELNGNRNVFNSRFNPAQQAGSRAFILQQADDTAVTAADGSSRIATSGSTRVRGRMSNGFPFTAGSALAQNGNYPFYLSLSRGTQVVIGWLNFPSTPTPTASGTVVWVGTGTNAFAATLRAASAP